MNYYLSFIPGFSWFYVAMLSILSISFIKSILPMYVNLIYFPIYYYLFRYTRSFNIGRAKSSVNIGSEASSFSQTIPTSLNAVRSLLSLF